MEHLPYGEEKTSDNRNMWKNKVKARTTFEDNSYKLTAKKMCSYHCYRHF